MRWRLSPGGTALLTISLALVGNMATGTVEFKGAWWPIATWSAVAILATIFVASEIRLGKWRQPSDLDSLEFAAAELATAVKEQWEAEVRRRQLNDPYPLPVRWHAETSGLGARLEDARRLATEGAGWPARPDGVKWATRETELAGSGGGLAQTLGLVPTRRLVVLGRPGAGKTMLLVRLLLDLLSKEKRSPGDPVPLLVSIASWDPSSESLRAWLAARLIIDYQALAQQLPARGARGRRTLAQAMIDEGLIMMLLDGLDEIPQQSRRLAIQHINEITTAGEALVLSSRVDSYRETVRPPGGAELLLTGAVAIELEPVSNRDVIEYLRKSAGGVDAAARWDDVDAALTANPSGPLAKCMTTPLMASLARTIYNPRSGETTDAVPDPAALLSKRSREEIERHLFDGYVPAAYRPHPSWETRWSVAKAQQWLGYLAFHLETDQQGRPDLAWWRLRTRPAARTKRQILAIALLCSLLSGLAAGVLYGSAYGSADVATSIGLRVACVAGATFGVAQWLTGRLSASLTSVLIGGLAGGLAADLVGDVSGGVGSLRPLDLVMAAGVAAGLTSPLRRGVPTGVRAGVVAGGAASVSYVVSVLAIGLIQDPSGGSADAARYWLDGVRYYGLATGVLVGAISSLARASANSADGVPLVLSVRGWRRFRSNPVVVGVITLVLSGFLIGMIDWLPWRYDYSPLYILGDGLLLALAVSITIHLANALQRPPGESITVSWWRNNPLTWGVTALGFTMLLSIGYDESLLPEASVVASCLLVGLAASVAVMLANKAAGGSRRVEPRRAALHIIAATAMAGLAVTVVGSLQSGFMYGLTLGLKVSLLYSLALTIGARRASTRDVHSSSAAERAWTALPAIGVGYALFYALTYQVDFGLAGGLVACLAIELAARLTLPILPASSLRLSSVGVLLGLLTAVVVAIFLGERYTGTTVLSICGAIGGAAAVVYGLDTPRDISPITDPSRVLRRDRLTCAVVTVAIACALGVAVALTAGEGETFDMWTGLLGTGTYGVALGLTVAAGRTAWPQYVLVRFKLASARYTPWQLMRFLADAHMKHGVLRQNGATYQFRHLDLQRRLAATWAAESGRSLTSDPGRAGLGRDAVDRP